jgi:hypothetical protein
MNGQKIPMRAGQVGLSSGSARGFFILPVNIPADADPASRGENVFHQVHVTTLYGCSMIPLKGFQLMPVGDGLV